MMGKNRFFFNRFFPDFFLMGKKRFFFNGYDGKEPIFFQRFFFNAPIFCGEDIW